MSDKDTISVFIDLDYRVFRPLISGRIVWLLVLIILLLLPPILILPPRHMWLRDDDLLLTLGGNVRECRLIATYGHGLG